MNNSPVSGAQRYNPSLRNLRSLLTIRSAALLTQAGVLAYVCVWHKQQENLAGLATGLIIMVLINLISLLRCRHNRAVTDLEFASQLLVDVIGWAGLMYVSGGANNPFISYLLVPLVIAAAMLPWLYTWLVAGLSMLCYTLLLYQYQPFPLFAPSMSTQTHHMGNVHILGMWFNFFVSAGLITYFVVRMAATLRQAQESASKRREDTLRNEQIMAVATLAAGTAHEFGTPLATLTLLAEEELETAQTHSSSAKNLQLMQSQINHCKAILSRLSQTAQLSSADNREPHEAYSWLEQRVQRWAVRRPAIRYQCQWQGSDTPPRIYVDPTLAQAFENLLDNAANADARQLSVTMTQTPQALRITIVDDGTGIDPQQLANLGKPILQSRKEGLGLGLLLSHATVERYGGRIELSHVDPKGTQAVLSLPLDQLSTANAL